MKNRILLILVAIVLALSMGLVGCGGEQAPEVTEYNLTISSTEGGEVATPGDGTFNHEERIEVPLVALSHAGYRFQKWSGDVTSIADVNAASTAITVNGNYSITANFIAQYVLTIDSTEGGEVTQPGEGTRTYDEGTDVHLVAVTDQGYFFYDWVGDVGGIADVKNPTTTITMNADYVVTAEFGDPTTQRATILVDGNPDDWSSLEPAAVDPQGDCICDADDDVKYIYTAMDDSYAYVMVETYAVPIDGSAVIEINFDYKPGKQLIHGGACCDDLHTNVSGGKLYAMIDDGSIGVHYPINGYLVVWGNVMELKIPLSQLENASWFNPIFVNTWDYRYQIQYSGCDGCTVYFDGWR